MHKKAEKIKNATIKLFLHNGSLKYSMDEIAQNANASKVTIYKYFADKDALYYEIGRHIFTEYSELLEQAVSADTLLTHRLYSFMDIVCDFINSGRLTLCMELTNYNEAVEKEQSRYVETYRQSMLRLIDEGIAHGLIKPDVDKEMAFHYINMGIVYYQQNKEYRGLMLSQSGFRQRFMRFCIGNIFVDEAQIILEL